MTIEEPEASPEPTFGDQLTAALPAHTHVVRTLFGDTSWTWTTQDGKWTVTLGGLFFREWTLSGPRGKWMVDRDRVIPVLRALGAIDPEAGDGS